MKSFTCILLATAAFAGVSGVPSRAAESIRVAVQKTGTFAWELAVIRAHGLDRQANLTIQVNELASPEAGKIWVSTGAIVSPNKGVTAAAYPNPLVKAEADQVKNATVFVFDGSDLMPGSLGEDWGTVLQTVLKDPSKIDSQLGSFQTEAKDAFASG